MSGEVSKDAEKFSEIAIRRAVPTDAVDIAALLKAAFQPYRPLYTPAGYAATTLSPEGVIARIHEGPVFVAVDHETIIGTASIVAHDQEVYIRGMAVDPEYRGRKVGLQLLKTIETLAHEMDAQRLVLCTTPFLDRAIHLYSSFGFDRVTEDPDDLYGTPLRTMVKILSNT